MASNSQGISLQITVHIAPENLSKFWEAFKPVYKNVIMEPDCTYFEVFHSHKEPGTLSWIENWFALPIQVVYSFASRYIKCRSKPKEWVLEVRLYTLKLGRCRNNMEYKLLSKKDYYNDFIASMGPMFTKREMKVFDRIGSPYVTVKRENGGYQGDT